MVVCWQGIGSTRRHVVIMRDERVTQPILVFIPVAKTCELSVACILAVQPQVEAILCAGLACHALGQQLTETRR